MGPGTSSPALAAETMCAATWGSEGQITGTAGDDTIHGTEGNDVIYGISGNDVIYGLGGHDIICAGPGNDRIYPGKGRADMVFADEGNNVVDDVDGAFSISAGLGDDRLSGGYSVIAGGGNDYIDSSIYPSGVTIQGGDGDDTLIGSDFLIDDAERAMDKLYAGAGNDTVFGGRSGEYVWPGAGDDIVHAGAHNGWNTILYLEDAPGPMRVDLRSHSATGDGTDRLWGINVVVGSAFDDVLIGAAGNDILRGCGGADTLVGHGGADFLQGDDLNPDADNCPGKSTDQDVARGGLGRDVCGAETMRGCEKEDGDPVN